jgi:hypothetical protein
MAGKLSRRGDDLILREPGKMPSDRLMGVFELSPLRSI